MKTDMPDLSVINRNVLSLMFSLRDIEHRFMEELKKLESEQDVTYDDISDKFYDSYTRMDSAIKILFAETVSENIEKSAV